MLAGGTETDARLAADVAPGDHVALAAALTAVRALAGVRRDSRPSRPLARRALLEERDRLTSDVLRTNAVALAPSRVRRRTWPAR